MTLTLSRLTAAATLTLASLAAHAGPIPYPSAGVENATLYTFTAASTGSIGAYFFDSNAAYTNVLTMLVNGVESGIVGLNNQTSSKGDFLDLGAVNAGDVVVFKLINLVPGAIGPWYSDKSLNVDGSNHVYSTDFAGDTEVPGGTYVGFEDLDSRTGTDFNYNDLSFVFTNISTSTGVPVPATPALLLAAGLAAAALRRRAH